MNYKQFSIGILAISISSLLYFDILIADFRITFAIVTMGAFLYLFRRINPIIIGVIISFTTLFVHLLVSFIEFGNIEGTVVVFFPEMAFYIMFGIIIKYTMYNKKIFNLYHIFGIVLLGDFFSNVLEVSLRIGFLNQTFNQTIFPTLFLVAGIRAFILIFILKGIKLYRLLLIREEHDLRYQRLIHMTMLLKDEMYWLEKNTVRIESSMANAYNLFETLNESDNEDLAKKSLSIASDIHEIKKEYDLVLRGFKEITEEKYIISKMKFSDMLRILKTTMEYEISQKGINISIIQYSTEDFSTVKHFQLMSVLRNLIANSIDAYDDNLEGKIFVNHYKKKENHYFIVEDRGKGISNKIVKDIFNPGFSTKIDYSTGIINRGIGLSLVKDIVEKYFKGKITVETKLRTGAKFCVVINQKYLEEQIDENIYIR